MVFCSGRVFIILTCELDLVIDMTLQWVQTIIYGILTCLSIKIGNAVNWIFFVRNVFQNFCFRKFIQEQVIHVNCADNPSS